MNRKGMKLIFVAFVLTLLTVTHALPFQTILNSSSSESTQKIPQQRAGIWGAPDPPNLSVIQPNPNTNGKISLSWEHSGTMDHYWVFRHTANITTTDGLSPIAQVNHPTQTYTDTVTVIGTYFYAIVAYAEIYSEKNSTHSNCENVTVTSIDAGGVSSFDLHFVILGIFTVIGIALLVNRRKENLLSIS